MKNQVDYEEASRPMPQANYVRHYARFNTYWTAYTLTSCSSSNNTALEGGCFITYYADANNWSLRYIDSADSPYVFVIGGSVKTFSLVSAIAYKTGTLSVRFSANYKCSTTYNPSENYFTKTYDFYI